MTACAVDLNRYEIARRNRQYHMLSESEEMQEERIASHYVAFAHLALQLKKMNEIRKMNRESSPELNEHIRWLTSKIREGHLTEFGIELEWKHQPKEKE